MIRRYYIWPVILVGLILVGGCANQSSQFEPNVTRSFADAEQYISSGNVSQADRRIHLAIAQTRHKADAYLYGLAILNPTTSDSTDVLRLAAGIASETQSLSDQNKLDRKLTQDELKALMLTEGQLLSKLHRPYVAIPIIERAHKLWPDDIGICNDLGYFYADTNTNLNLALVLTRKAVSEEPKQAMYIDSLGWVYYRLGRNQDALRELLKAVDISPDNADLRIHLGAVYFALGKSDEAAIEFEKAKTLAMGDVKVQAENWLQKLTKTTGNMRKM